MGGPFGGPPWCDSGTHCAASPPWLPGKLQAYWEWALAEPAIQGINPWHWSDRISMSATDGFARGAVSLGPEVREWFEWIGGNVTKAPRPPGEIQIKTNPRHHGFGGCSERARPQRRPFPPRRRRRNLTIMGWHLARWAKQVGTGRSSPRRKARPSARQPVMRQEEAARPQWLGRRTLQLHVFSRGPPREGRSAIIAGCCATRARLQFRRFAPGRVFAGWRAQRRAGRCARLAQNAHRLSSQASVFVSSPTR